MTKTQKRRRKGWLWLLIVLLIALFGILGGRFGWIPGLGKGAGHPAQNGQQGHVAPSVTQQKSSIKEIVVKGDQILLDGKLVTFEELKHFVQAQKAESVVRLIDDSAIKSVYEQVSQLCQAAHLLIEERTQ